ncbi:hypothetical protein L9F63_025652, partial [Diploptera punctata]
IEKMASNEEGQSAEPGDNHSITPLLSKMDLYETIAMEEMNDEDLEIINCSDVVEAHTVNMYDGELKDDDDKLVIDEDFDSNSDSEEQQAISEYMEDDALTKELEQDLTNRFLNGELTFSEYAALMEGSEVDDAGIDVQPATTVAMPSFIAPVYSSTSAEADAFEKELIESSRLKGKRRGGEKSVRRRRRILPPALQGLMGEANLRYARAHLSPTDLEQWIRLAVMSEEQGNIKQAITCYSKAISADPTNVDIHMKRGMMLEQIGERKTALKGYQKLLFSLPPEQGAMIIQVSKMLACKFHEDNELLKAKEK